MNQLEILNLRIQQLASDPGSPVDGQIWYNTTSKVYKGRQNATTVILATMADLASFITASSTTTLTNKTFDANGTGNSITNIETADFATNVIDTDAALAANSATRIASQSAVKSYVDNNIQGLKWKDAVRVATATAGTLASSFANGQTVDGIVVATGDRILLKDQAAGAENGIYTVNASGAPTRGTDADLAAEVWKLAVFVLLGTANAGLVYANNNATVPTLGSTALTFAQVGGGTVPNATTSTFGKVQLATAAEAKAKSDSAKAVVSSALTDFPIKYSASIGDGATLAYIVTHSIGNTDVHIQVARVASPFDIINCDIERTSTTTCTIRFAVAPTTNQYRVTVIG